MRQNMYVEVYETMRVTWNAWISMLTQVIDIYQPENRVRLDTITEQDIEDFCAADSDTEAESEPEVSVPSCSMM
jgi:hypothetical protein